MKMIVKNKKKKPNGAGGSRNKYFKVYFIEIGTILNVFTSKHYLSISLPPKETFATKSEPYRLLMKYRCSNGY